MPGRGRGAPEDEEAWADRATDQAPRRPLEHIPPQGISRITTAAIPAPVKATAPRCSIRLTAASIILASWHSRMRAFGQRLTAASYVALASMKSWTPANWSTISPLSSTSSTLCLKWLRNTDSQLRTKRERKPTSEADVSPAARTSAAVARSWFVGKLFEFTQPKVQARMRSHRLVL